MYTFPGLSEVSAAIQHRETRPWFPPLQEKTEISEFVVKLQHKHGGKPFQSTHTDREHGSETKEKEQLPHSCGCASVCVIPSKKQSEEQKETKVHQVQKHMTGVSKVTDHFSSIKKIFQIVLLKSPDKTLA